MLCNRSLTMLLLYAVVVLVVLLFGLTVSSSNVLADGNGGDPPAPIDTSGTGGSSAIPAGDTTQQLSNIDMMLLLFQSLP